LELVDDGFFTDHPLYSVVPEYMIQFGISGDPEEQYEAWDKYPIIEDDQEVGVPFKYGSICFAGSAQDTRRTDLWISFTTDQEQLKWWGQDPWERPIGMVVLETPETGEKDGKASDTTGNSGDDGESFLYGDGDGAASGGKKNILQRLYSGYGERSFVDPDETESNNAVPAMLPGQEDAGGDNGIAANGISVPKLQREGASFVRAQYPLTDFIKKCTRRVNRNGKAPGAYADAVKFYTPPGVADPTDRYGAGGATDGPNGASGGRSEAMSEEAMPEEAMNAEAMHDEPDGADEEVNVAFTLPTAALLRERLRSTLTKRLAKFDGECKAINRL
jgi:hypothetical protein